MKDGLRLKRLLNRTTKFDSLQTHHIFGDHADRDQIALSCRPRRPFSLLEPKDSFLLLSPIDGDVVLKFSERQVGRMLSRYDCFSDLWGEHCVL